MNRLMYHLSGWRVAHDSETGGVVFFNDLTMCRHCYSIADVLCISIEEAGQ